MKKILITLYGLYLNFLAWAAPSVAAKKGFLLFCRPFRGPITDRQQSFFNSAKRFGFTHSGQVVQAYQWGTGPTKVLFLHGWQSHSYRWKAYVDALSGSGHTVYAFDAPGHGMSGGNFLSVPLYSAMIEGFVRTHGPMHTIVAHSIGGFSLMYALFQYATLEPKKVVIMGTPGEATEFVDVFKTTLSLSDRAVDRVIDYFVKTYDVSPEYFSLTKFAENVHAESLIIHDEDDPEAPYAYAKQLHAALKNSRLMTTRGLGHNLKSPHVVQEVAGFIGALVPS